VGPKKQIFQCETCGKVCRDTHNLNRHRRVHEKERKKEKEKSSYICDQCHRHCKNEEDLINHRKDHKRNGGGGVCKTCGQQFTTDLQLDRHKRHVHGVAMEDMESQPPPIDEAKKILYLDIASRQFENFPEALEKYENNAKDIFQTNRKLRSVSIAFCKCFNLLNQSINQSHIIGYS